MMAFSVAVMATLSDILHTIFVPGFVNVYDFYGRWVCLVSDVESTNTTPVVVSAPQVLMYCFWHSYLPVFW